MYAFLIVIHIIVSLVLILVILLQAGKGGGLSEMFGGSGSAQTFLGSKASAFLTKATTVCAILFIITSVSLTILSSHRARSIMESSPIPQAQMPQAPLEAPVQEAQPEPAEPATP